MKVLFKVKELLRDLLLGVTSAAIAKTVMAPIERINLLMLTQDCNPLVMRGEVERYATRLDCFVRVRHEQGMQAFWRGNLSNSLRYAPQQGSTLAFNDFLNAAFPHYSPHTDPWKSLATKLLSGGLAGATAMTLFYPCDSFAKPHLLKGGLPALYRGWSLACLSVFVFRAGQLGFFKQIQELNPYQRDEGAIGAVTSFAAVSVARTAAVPFSYPVDSLRRRLWLQLEKLPSERTYKGSLDCLKQVMEKEGLKGVYKGMLPEFFRGVGGSLVVVTYDRMKVILSI
eukprot:TRINITY_DN1206_c0_g1_i1.p1 TRINITY_DN1206_c0_g1~~TRINITY_DN1206_c0_g1_i1.p1  ORF type:complete len:284 (+),score=23.75 TRINITY_DN1206_c0_g1_i1:48-899(+)